MCQLRCNGLSDGQFSRESQFDSLSFHRRGKVDLKQDCILAIGQRESAFLSPTVKHQGVRSISHSARDHQTL
eukprot:gene5119-biopygen12977